MKRTSSRHGAAAVTRVDLKGIHVVRKTLADGTVRSYHYAWRGGPRIEAAPGTAEYAAEFAAHMKTARPAPVGDFMRIIRAYQRSTEFTGLADRTRKDYGRYLRMIEDEFGDASARVIEDKRMRRKFKEWRDGFAGTPRKADMAWTVLARVLSWAKDVGEISANVAERGGRLYSSDRAEVLWTDEQVARAGNLPPHLWRVFMIALWTGQRQGDVLRLPWSAYDGHMIRLRQSKTKVRVAIPCAAPLRSLLDDLPRLSPIILLSTDGRPWTSDGFRASWARACEAAGISGVHFNDLRGTAITRLAEAECTEAEIASITGHSIGTVSNVLASYLARSETLAKSAIGKLERADRERGL